MVGKTSPRNLKKQVEVVKDKLKLLKTRMTSKPVPGITEVESPTGRRC